MSAGANRCVITTPTLCQMHGGTYAGNGTTCGPDQCPQPTGACCLLDKGGKVVCEELSKSVCRQHGGTFHGVDSSCENRLCNGCPCDYKVDGVVNDADLQAFLIDYQNGDADINGDGGTNQLDLHLFMSCFAAPGAECAP